MLGCRQGRYFLCFKAPVRCSTEYSCTNCMRPRAVTSREQANIQAEIQALKRAERLPPPHRRFGSGVWQLLGPRQFRALAALPGRDVRTGRTR